MEYPDYSGMGIYALVDENGKMYVGSSKNIKLRFYQHEKAMQNGHANSILQDAYNKGAVFHGVILEKIDYGENAYYLLEREAAYIEKLDTINNGYNLSPFLHDRKELDQQYLEWAIKKDSKWEQEQRKRIAEMSAPIFPDKWITLFVKKANGGKAKYKKAAAQMGLTVSEFFRLAANEKIERDGLSDKEE